MAKHTELAKELEPRLERDCRDEATRLEVPWLRRTRLVAGNFTQCPKSQSDMWGRCGTRRTSHGPQVIYVNVRTIQEHIPSRIKGALKRALKMEDAEAQEKEIKRIAQKLDDWVVYWLGQVLAPRVVKFSHQLDGSEGIASSEGRNLFTSIDTPQVNRLEKARREHHV